MKVLLSKAVQIEAGLCYNKAGPSPKTGGRAIISLMIIAIVSYFFGKGKICLREGDKP